MNKSEILKYLYILVLIVGLLFFVFIVVCYGFLGSDPLHIYIYPSKIDYCHNIYGNDTHLRQDDYSDVYLYSCNWVSKDGELISRYFTIETYDEWKVKHEIN